MFDNIIMGCDMMFHVKPMLMLMLGAFGGLIIGAIPGLTATMAIALMVPITYTMSIIPSTALLIGIYVGGISGGLISAAMLRIPGTPSSVATTYDAYPMVQKGKANKALGIGITASFVGGITSGLLLTMIAPTLAKVALKFGPFEYLSLVIFTFCCVASLSEKSMLKSFYSANLGLVLAIIGSDPIVSVERFTFGYSQLAGGFSLLPVLIGMFAVPQLMTDIKKSGLKAVSVKSDKINAVSLLSNFKYIIRSRLNCIRSVLIGTGIGILPGVGPGLSNILSYAQAKAASKQPEKFGTGIPDGIIASESANNASMGGALVPLLTLGIPGDAATLVMLGAFMLQGIQPGPLMFKTNPDVVYSIFVAFFLAAIIVLLLQAFLMNYFIKLLAVKKEYLSPILLVLCAIGSYALNNRLFDVWLFVIFGLVGYMLEHFQIPILPLILGLILGPMAEIQLRTGLSLSQGSLLPIITRPIPAVFFILAIAMVVSAILKQRKSNIQAEIE